MVRDEREGTILYVPPTDTCIFVCYRCWDHHIVLSNMIYYFPDLCYLVLVPVRTDCCLTLPFRLVISLSLFDVSHTLGMPMIWLIYRKSVHPCGKC